MLFRDLDFCINRVVYCNSRHFAKKVKRGGGGGVGGWGEGRKTKEISDWRVQAFYCKVKRQRKLLEYFFIEIFHFALSISISSVETKWKPVKRKCETEQPSEWWVFFFNCTSITNWHVITARYLSERVAFLSYLIFSAVRGTIEAVNVVITHFWRTG